MEEDPDFFQARLNLGVILARQEAFREALVHIERARDLDPDHEKCHRTLLFLYRRCNLPAKEHAEEKRWEKRKGGK